MGMDVPRFVPALLRFFCVCFWKAALLGDLPTAKKAMVDREMFCLLEKGLAPNLMSFVAELLGPEGLRRASPATGAAVSGNQVGDGGGEGRGGEGESGVG